MNLLFDLDGTLRELAVGIARCLAHKCERLGAPVPSPPIATGSRPSGSTRTR